jgi:hypothetical protein
MKTYRRRYDVDGTCSHDLLECTTCSAKVDGVLMETPRFGNWLESTGQLQRSFGVDFRTLRESPIPLADYITWNFTALYEELGEMSHELPWAPWKGHRGMLTVEARERALGEAVDALHFLGNILNALGVDDVDLSEAYMAKQAINRSRLVSGRSLATPGTFGEILEVEIDLDEDGEGARQEEADREYLAHEVKAGRMHYPTCPMADGVSVLCICSSLAKT